jgi:hypothetical protein
VNEYIKQTYGSLLRFLQDRVHSQEFKLTEDKYHIYYNLNLQKWFFQSKNIHDKIFEKYKGQVGCPKDFIWKIERHKDTTVSLSMGTSSSRVMYNFGDGPRFAYVSVSSRHVKQ